MPKYRALAKLYVAEAPGALPKLVNTGEYFDSTDTPGSRWEPVDEAAKAVVASNPPRRAFGRTRALRPLPGQPEAEAAPRRRRRAARGAAKRAKGQRGTVAASKSTPTPGRSVTRQQTDGEEPTQEK